MIRESSLFGLRFDSNADLNPSREELAAFLESTAKEGSREPHQNDLARYRRLLEGLRDLETARQPGPARWDAREMMFYSVLGHSQFAHPGLALAVAQFKFHLHALADADPLKPSAFVRSARAEMARLDPRKKDDAARLARLERMVRERKGMLDGLPARRLALVRELESIARYVRANLVRIGQLCDASVAILADPAVAAREEKGLIDDIKERSKDQLKDSLHAGRLSRQDLEAAKQDVELLSQEVSSLLHGDIDALQQLYRAVHDHVRSHAADIDRILAGAGSGAGRTPALFSRLEEALVSLVSRFPFELHAREVPGDAVHARDLNDARQKLLHHLFMLLDRDRRVWSDRRSGEDRRGRREPCVRYSEHRKGGDRRSGKSRRSEVS